MSDKFKYEYQAPTQEERMEITNIQKKYLLENSKNMKLKRLKCLDARVKNIPAITAYTMGVIGILVFGTGLTCILEWDIIFVGILIMILGAFIVLPAYFVHSFLLKKLKMRYKDEILKLSDELLNEKK